MILVDRDKLFDQLVAMIERLGITEVNAAVGPNHVSLRLTEWGRTTLGCLLDNAAAKQGPE